MHVQSTCQSLHGDGIPIVLYNVALRCARGSIVAVEMQYVLFILSIALGIQRAAPYDHLRPAGLYNIFPHYFINDTGGKSY